MAYEAFNSRLFKPALFASMLTSGLAGIALITDSYIGSPHGSMFAKMMPSDLVEVGWAIIWILALFLPGAMFGAFAVFPLTLLAAGWALRFEATHAQLYKSHWPLAGALLGGPALFLYSFPLGLGQALIGQLLANGVVFGTVCACLTRLFIRRNIVDAAVAADDE